MPSAPDQSRWLAAESVRKTGETSVARQCLPELQCAPRRSYTGPTNPSHLTGLAGALRRSHQYSGAPIPPQVTRRWRAQWRAASMSPNFLLQIATSARGLRIRVRRFDSSRGHCRIRQSRGRLTRESRFPRVAGGNASGNFPRSNDCFCRGDPVPSSAAGQCDVTARDAFARGDRFPCSTSEQRAWSRRDPARTQSPGGAGGSA